jgi:hypothetical protein
MQQPRHVHREVPDGQVQTPVEHALFQFGGGADVHVEVHIVPTGDEALGGARDRRVGVGDGGVDDPQVELAADVLLEHVGVHAEIFHRREQALGGFVDRHALLGQAKTAASALAELDPEPGFQMGHLFADGRLAGVQRRLRGREAAAADNGGKHPEQLQVDIMQLNHWDLPRVDASVMPI